MSILKCGIATALTVDYFTNQVEDEATVSSFKDSLYEYFTKFKTTGARLRDRQGWEYQQVLSALVVLLGIVGGIRYVANQYTTIPPPLLPHIVRDLPLMKSTGTDRQRPRTFAL